MKIFQFKSETSINNFINEAPINKFINEITSELDPIPEKETSMSWKNWIITKSTLVFLSLYYLNLTTI